MSYVIYEDTVSVNPITIHKILCVRYTSRKLNATTSKWHLCDTLKIAEDYAEKLVRTRGCKHCNHCLDGAEVHYPKPIS